MSDVIKSYFRCRVWEDSLPWRVCQRKTGAKTRPARGAYTGRLNNNSSSKIAF